MTGAAPRHEPPGPGNPTVTPLVDTRYMTTNDQLQLVAADRSWKLDEQTRAAGRRGVAQAREALRQAAARQQGDRTPAAPAQAA